MADATDGSNSVIDGEESNFYTKRQKQTSDYTDEGLTILTILNRLISAIFFPNPNSSYASAPLLRRIKISVSENIPLLRQASENTGQHVLLWVRRGSPLRLLLVVSLGTIALLTLTGFAVFLIFFVAATVNAIVITLLMSLAAAGGFLALFFVCVAAIYVGTLMVSVFIISSATVLVIFAVMVSVFIISSATVLAIFAAVVVTGWIGFFWTVWVASKKSIGIAKHSVYMTGSALSAYSPARRHHELNKLG